MWNPCLFCGGNRDEPSHERHCDGRQGVVEAAAVQIDEDLPYLMSGLTEATYATSAQAAYSVDATKATQRRLVFEAIRHAGPLGRTDDELQAELVLDGSSERPRRWELWRLGWIRVKCDAAGAAIRRETRTQRRAVVWVAVED
jgi:hypothetical protein